MVEKVLLVDIDGLRPDIFTGEMQAGRLPHLAQLMGGGDLSRGFFYPLLAPAPSITFTSQACLFTGTHPAQHGIPGNQFFDRFGRHNHDLPRHYAFDVGDTLAADDAVRVFTDGLASACLLAPTLYERLAVSGKKSLVSAHMYAVGAETWIKPSLVNLARFTKGGNLFGLSAAEYDSFNLDNVLEAITRHGLPDIATVYFMGLDHESHQHGPQAQPIYLREVLDPLIGELWETITAQLGGRDKPQPLCILFSDHGQIGVPGDDRHSLRLGFPFERELGHLFDALNLDVHDFPGEDPQCDAVLACNGGLAHVYLQNRLGHWSDAPVFQRDILPVARAFWEAHATGRYARELLGSLAGVMVRDVEHGGWDAPYQAITPQGDLVSSETWFANQPGDLYVDPVHRLQNLVSPFTGDLLLISNYADGYYFAAPMAGMHGGLHPEDSWATLAVGWSGSPANQWEHVHTTFCTAIERRCQAENCRLPVTADMPVGLLSVLNNQ